MAREVAVGKRIKINKFQQQTLGLVLLAAVVLGVCLVVAIFFVKYINFNAKVIEEKDTAIKGYDTALSNSKMLQSTVLALADDENLESVSRGTLSDCYGSDGKKIDYATKYQQANNEEEAEENLEKMKACSALRVIPDALPAKQNSEALMASLDQIFKVSGWEPESLSPSGTASRSSISGLGVIPVSLSVEANTATTFTVLDNIEKSIRSFDISSATIGWSGDKLELRAQAAAYYTSEVEATETTKTVYASNEAKKASAAANAGVK